MHSPSGDAPCFGPWLTWQKSGSQVSDVNSHWRTVFSFNTSVFFDLWTPLFLGVGGLNVAVPSLMSGGGPWQQEQWRFCAVFYTLAAILGSFGYAGNLGILVGFANVVAAFGSLVSSFVAS